MMILQNNVLNYNQTYTGSYGSIQEEFDFKERKTVGSATECH